MDYRIIVMVRISEFKNDFLKENYIIILLQCFVWKLV
jgi:hypothetical protein